MNTGKVLVQLCLSVDFVHLLDSGALRRELASSDALC
jgi:hypothetical protein